MIVRDSTLFVAQPNTHWGEVAAGSPYPSATIARLANRTGVHANASITVAPTRDPSSGV